MPDRYGDTDEPAPAPTFACQPGYVADHQAAIDDCQLCDRDGNRNGFPCDHIDHAIAARRGMDMIRDALARKPKP